MRIAGNYFLAQGVIVPLWWLAIAFVPATRPWFLPGGSIDPAFAAFAAPDLLVLTLASLVAGGLARRRRPSARTWAWIATGATLYAAVYTVAWTVRLDAPLLSAVLMVAAAGLSVWCARQTV